MPYGYKFQIGVQRVAEPNPDRRRGVAAPVAALLVALALTVVALLIWPRSAPVESAPVAHVAPASSTPTATARATPTPPPVVRVTGQTGAVCFLPGGKTISPVTLAVVP